MYIHVCDFKVICNYVNVLQSIEMSIVSSCLIVVSSLYANHVNDGSERVDILCNFWLLDRSYRFVLALTLFHTPTRYCSLAKFCLMMLLWHIACFQHEINFHKPICNVLILLSFGFFEVERGGEDAFFVSCYNGGVIAVADGVSG